MADIDKSAGDVEIIVSFPLPTPDLSRFIWQPVTENMRQPNENTAMRLAPLSWQSSGAHHALEFLAQREEALSRDLEQARQDIADLRQAVRYANDHADQAKSERDAAIARAEKAEADRDEWRKTAITKIEGKTE